MRARNFLLWLCRELGVRVNLVKSSLDPSQTLDYLGMRLQTRPLRIFLTPKRVQKLSFLLHEFVSCQQQPLTLWRQFMGVMSSLSTIVPGSCLRMRSLQLCLNASGRFLPDSAPVSWVESCRSDLRWWSEESHLLVGLPLGLPPHPELALYTDASDSGWGAFIADDQLSGLWSPEFSNFSINHRELLAVLYGVQGFLPVFQGRSVSLRGQYDSSVLPSETGRDSLLHSEHGCPDHSPSLRGPSYSACSAVHSGSPKRSCGLSVAAHKSWAPNGPFVIRRFGSCFASGQ